MKAKRVVGVLAALLLCICMIMPVNTDAAAQTEEEINKVSDF